MKNNNNNKKGYKAYRKQNDRSKSLLTVIT